MRGTLEKIIWDDAGSFRDPDRRAWHTLEEIITAYSNASFVCSSVGYVVYEDKNSIILCMTYEDEWGQFTSPFRIPKKMVIERVKIPQTNKGKKQ